MQTKLSSLNCRHRISVYKVPETLENNGKLPAMYRRVHMSVCEVYHMLKIERNSTAYKVPETLE